MKGLIIFSMLIVVVFSAPSKAQSFRSDALDYIEEVFYAAEEDLSARYSFSHLLETKNIDLSKCDDTSLEDVFNLFDKAVDFYYSYFADEDLPVKEAKNDLSFYVGVKRNLMICQFDNNTIESHVIVDEAGNSIFQLHFIAY